MMIRLGNKDIKFALGDTEVQKMYLGDTLVYGGSEPVPTIENYITFEALETSTLGYSASGSAPTIHLLYSTDAVNWQPMNKDNDMQILKGHKLYVRGVGNGAFGTTTATVYNYFRSNSTSRLKVSGNLMWLLDSDDAVPMSMPECAFASLFRNNSGIVDVSELVIDAESIPRYACQYLFAGCYNLNTTPILPADEVLNFGYRYMFSACTAMVDIAKFELPATTLGASCYYGMFRGCTSLVTALYVLPAMDMANTCYNYMFYGCSALKQPPELPSTKAGSYTSCYAYMFGNCTSLEYSPILRSLSLGNQCYNYMFQNCSSLKEVYMYATSLTSGITIGNKPLANWLSGVKSGGVLHCNIGMTSKFDSGASGLPSSWTTIEEEPK